MKSELNCLDWRHPIKSIKRAYWRITKGFCPYDIWDWYTYMAQLIHDTLTYLADNHMGTMMEYENKDEEYTKKLKEVAKIILDATDFEETYENPFKEAYYKDLENVYMHDNQVRFDKTDPKLYKQYTHKEQENYEQAQKDLKEAFNWILDHWWELWD